MKEGDVVANRFVVERRAGTGGMGVVFRAVDRVTGEAVALKIMGPAAREEGGRSRREALLLAELVHPAIVRYVAHGMTGDGEAYLAMEWLEGEDLASRLARAPLTVAESVAITSQRATEGLAAAHVRGVVHRDVKPSNLFLVGGDPTRVKVLDFGLARSALASQPRTASGSVLGTVGYMAPEQARGDRDVDARADVFSLGCVLFECLTGRPAFVGEHAVAVLAKVLLEEATRLAEVRPELPAALDALVARMLGKDRAARFVDAGEVARALAEVDLGGEGARAPERIALSEAELRMVSVVLIELEGALDPADSTFRIGARDVAADAALLRIVAAHGASITPLSTGALLVTMQSVAGPRDGAARAAALSLSLCKALPDARVALATGRAQSSGHGVFGQVIDRAARLLAGRGARAGAVLVDEVTMALLDSRFETRREGDAALLVGSASVARGARTLLGRPTPCVGRDRELALLEATIAESAAESVARAVLVIGAPGAGKSRVGHELSARLARTPSHVLLSARAESVGAGSALTLSRQLLRAAAAIGESDSAELQRAALRAHLSSLSSLADPDRTADFLGELLGIATSPAGPALVSARAEPRLMADWLRRSVVAWIAAECATHPVVILLDDAHWGDAATMTWLGDALRAKGELPLTVIAFARPEVHDAFPALWADAGRTEVRLGPLPARWSARLTREVLGDRVDDATVARIVARADGNAFYLEELIRHVAEGGRVDALPESVLAMAEARLEHLSADDRRLLRAASVLGETFWDGAVAMLAPAATSISDVHARLDDLARRELVERTGEETYTSATEYRFRHGLLRDAAYATLTDADRVAGHLLACEWLERAGCRDDLALAEHAERGGDRARAVRYWLGAARAAQGPGELARVVELATRGIDAGAEGDALWALLLDRGHANSWRGDFPRAMTDFERVMASTPPASEPWMYAVSGALYLSTLNGDPSPVLAFTQAMLTTRPVRASATCGFSFGRAITMLLSAGRTQNARALARVVLDLEASTADPEPLFVVNMLYVRAILAAFVDDDAGRALLVLEKAQRLCADIGDPLVGVEVQLAQANVLAEIGDPASVARHEEILRTPDFHAIAILHVLTSMFLTRALRLAGRCAEARAVIERGRGTRFPFVEMFLATEEAAITLDEGDAALAHSLAMPHASADLPLAFVRQGALAAAARAALALNRPEEAMTLVGTALGSEVDMIANRSWLHLTRIEVLRALGRADEARVALATACARIDRVAANLSEEHRTSWRERVVPNARILALAQAD